MHFGVALDFGTQVRPVEEQLQRQIAVAEMAETAGFTAVAAGEVYAARSFHLPNSLLVLAALAGRTRMRLCTGVALLPAWQPWKLALDSAQVDQLAGGRLTLGVGLGSAAMQQLGGWDRTAIAETADETLAALRALWRGDAGSAGQHVAVKSGLPILPIQPNGPPLWVGGGIRRSVRRAAQFGDGWYAGVNFRLDDIPRQVAAYREAQTRAGGDPAVGAVAINRLTLGAESDAEARELAERYFGPSLQSYARGGSTAAVAAQIGLIGGPDQLRDQVERYRAAGVTQLMLRLSLEEMPLPLTASTIELFGKHVLPNFAGG